VKPITNSVESDRDEALAWLAGALRWEQVLCVLREEAGGDAAVRAPAVTTPGDLPVRRAEAA